jgi:hypothetical protein
VIRHIVFFTARDKANIDLMLDGLAVLRSIPHSSTFEVRRNSKIDQIGNAVDVVVYAEFADEQALFAYKAHRNYAEATWLVRPLRELRLAAGILAAEPSAKRQGRQ